MRFLKEGQAEYELLSPFVVENRGWIANVYSSDKAKGLLKELLS